MQYISPLESSSVPHSAPSTGALEPSSPVSKLPTELLILIFQNCGPSYGSCDPEVGRVDNPITLSQVCRRWRHVALSTTQLWSAFQIDLTERTPETILKELDHWLERSGTNRLSVDVSYRCRSRIRDNVEKLGLQVIARLGSHASRWQKFGYHGPSAMLSSFPDEAPSHLSSFTLDVHYLKAGYISEDLDTSFDVWSLPLPYSGLTTLYLRPEPHREQALDESLALIAKCPKLLRCTLATRCAYMSDVKPLHEPACHLEYLHLQVTEEEATPSPLEKLARFLGSINPDNLNELTIGWTRRKQPRDSAESALSDFFSKCARLKRMSLKYVPLTTNGLSSGLSTLDNLESLELNYADSRSYYSPITQDFLLALRRRTEHDMHLASLHTLRITSSTEKFDEGDVREFIGQRMGGGEGYSALKEITLRWDLDRVKSERWVQEMRATYPELTLEAWVA